ncbi:hypothetical protein [Lentzea sp. NPDC060358]|uniref:hypothetical protein n=1 Tax=Lentzea sp. NPDC060358 TaxID=3347103 RepID=UPI0036479000
MKANTALAALAAVAAVVVTGPGATAQEEVTPVFEIAPNVLQMEQHFEVQPVGGTCPGGSESTTSPGFAAPVPAGGLHGIAASTPGKFTATLKCKGSSKTGTAEFEVVDRRATPRFTIVPSTLQQGQPFEVRIEKGDCPNGGEIRSAGFREWLRPGQLHGIAGYGLGTQYAELYCEDHAYRGTAEFEVVAKPQTPSAPHMPKAKTPVVVPKGAPQTGGGGTA